MNIVEGADLLIGRVFPEENEGISQHEEGEGSLNFL